jgi:hypothetical protein
MTLIFKCDLRWHGAVLRLWLERVDTSVRWEGEKKEELETEIIYYLGRFSRVEDNTDYQRKVHIL